MEYAPKGTLLNLISSNKFSIEELKTIFKKICQAVKYIHFKGISHRDLKLENVLMFEENQKFQPKLSDFGFASQCFK
jgi:serine/threonine protein kinase